MLKMGRRLLGQPEAKAGPERRSGKRVPLPVPVRVQVADQPARPARVGEVNLPGFSLEPCEGARVGEPVRVEFDGYPDVSPPFAVQGQIVRIIGDHSEAMAIEVDRKGTPPDALKHYRSLVRHYLHHKPLLEDINKGYFEGKCESCGWVGRVGRRAPRCSQSV
jgi:hypothetical protein